MSEKELKDKFKNAYMDVAVRFSQLSYAKRLQVGAIIVKENRIISLGYNGTPAGWDNECEYEEEILVSELRKGTWVEKTGQLKTKPEVLHAERNALDKLARCHESGNGASMFVTHSPCLECAKSIFGAGITHVYYKNDNRTDDGIKFLQKCGVIVENINEEN